MRELATETVGEELSKGWIESAPSVGFTVWDNKDRRTIYLLNTDWQSDEQQHTAIFVYAGKKFPVDVRRYHIETVHCANGLAINPGSNTTDILSINKEGNSWKVTVQNTEKDTIRCFNAETGTTTTVVLDSPSVHVITVGN